MEQTTLQQRIEERATQRLLKDLYNASTKLDDVGRLIQHDFRPLLSVTSYRDYGNKDEYTLRNDASKDIFNRLLPNYIRAVTDEILQKIDEIDYLLDEKRTQDY